jgi:uncharacterized repeat protein (TIGR01451 family)
MIAKQVGGCLAALVLVGVASGAEAQTANLQVTIAVTSPAIPPAAGVNPGSNIVYEVQVQNLGPSTATTVSATSATPSGLTFVSNTGACTTAFPCALGSMTSGQTKTFTTTYLVPASYSPPTAIRDSVSVTSAVADPVSSNNFAFNVTPVNGINCGNFAVTGGTAHTCSVVAGNGKPPPNTLEDDVVECFGDNFSQQSGPVASGTFEQLSAGAFHTCGLRTTGDIVCWGGNSAGQVSEAPAGTDFIQIDAGFTHTCAVRTDHSVVCWGSNTFGEEAAPAGLFVQVAAGNVHSCGLHTNGTIECWGLDGDSDESGDRFCAGRRRRRARVRAPRRRDRRMLGNGFLG